MKTAGSSKGRRGLKFGMAGVLGLSLIGIFAFKEIFPHSGEKALDLVPENALVAATLDLDPAPSQLIAFKRIDDALKRNGFGDSVGGAVKKASEGFFDIKGLWALSKHSISMCVMKSPGKKTEPVEAVLIPLNDGPAAERILKKFGKALFWKGTSYYRLTNSKVDAMVIKNTLVGSNQPQILNDIAMVADGRAKSITQAKGFEEARAKEPADASLIVMVSPNIGKLADTYIPSSALGWTSLSVTVQAGGLALSGHGKEDPSAGEAAAVFASIKPLRKDLLKILPAGAYGVYAISQPSKYFSTAETTAMRSNSAKETRKEEDDFRKEFGIDLVKDFIPALKGDAVIAAYPSVQPEAGIDFLVVADNQNGADPQRLATKIQAYVDRQVSKPKIFGKNWLTTVSRPDGTEFALSPSAEKKAFGWAKSYKTGAIHMATLTSDKTLTWANVSGAFFFATSQKLLDNSISTYQGKGANLVADAAIASGLKSSGVDQTVTVVNLARIARGIRDTAKPAKMSPDISKGLEQFLGIIDHLTTPLTIQSSTAPDGVSVGSAYIPVDYDKLIDLIGSYTKPKKTAVSIVKV